MRTLEIDVFLRAAIIQECARNSKVRTTGKVRHNLALMRKLEFKFQEYCSFTVQIIQWRYNTQTS